MTSAVGRKVKKQGMANKTKKLTCSITDQSSICSFWIWTFWGWIAFYEMLHTRTQ